jgi:hypothetical protein
MKTGDIFLRDGTVLPKSFLLETTSYTQGWHTVNGHDNFSLDRMLRAVGWGLTFIAGGEVKSVIVGAHGDASISRTVKSVLSKIYARSFNCARLSSITDRRFLGIPYTIVSGSAYNLQHGSQLQSAAERQVVLNSA